MLQQGRVDDAIELFKLNVANYPESFNTYDSLGDAYRAKGDKTLAIESYEKSLKLNPANEDGARKLRELKSQEEHK